MIHALYDHNHFTSRRLYHHLSCARAPRVSIFFSFYVDQISCSLSLSVLAVLCDITWNCAVTALYAGHTTLVTHCWRRCSALSNRPTSSSRTERPVNTATRSDWGAAWCTAAVNRPASCSACCDGWFGCLTSWSRLLFWFSSDDPRGWCQSC